MDKLSIIVVPSNKGKTKTFHIPTSLVRSGYLALAIITILIAIIAFDYFQLLGNTYQTKSLSIENRQLKEQIQIFQTKMNALTGDLERIEIFEKKLRILSGLDKEKLSEPFFNKLRKKTSSDNSSYDELLRQDFLNKAELKDFEKTSDFQNLKTLYLEKLFSIFGVNNNYQKKSNYFSQLKDIDSLSESFAKFDYKYSRIKKINSTLEENLNQLDQYLLDKKSHMRSTPILMPVNGWITSFYGPRVNPTSGKLKMHEGIDVGAPFGAKITAPADGVVVFSGTKPGFGKHVQIDHGYGIETLYAHSQKLFVKKNQEVKRGQLLASVGSTGHSTGPHLHYEVRVNGVSVDPYYFLLDH